MDNRAQSFVVAPAQWDIHKLVEFMNEQKKSNVMPNVIKSNSNDIDDGYPQTDPLATPTGMEDLSTLFLLPPEEQQASLDNCDTKTIPTASDLANIFDNDSCDGIEDLFKQQTEAGKQHNEISTMLFGTSSSEVFASSIMKETRNGQICSVLLDQWGIRFQELYDYYKQHGHSSVPHNHVNGPLAQWVKRQRHQMKRKARGEHSTLTEARIYALNEIRFVWDAHAIGWEERWNELLAFKEMYGHSNVPARYPENPSLAIWVKSQRRQIKLWMKKDKNASITADRIKRLLSIGFDWNPRNL